MQELESMTQPVGETRAERCTKGAYRKGAACALALPLAANLLAGAFIAMEHRNHALELESLREDVKVAEAMRDQAVALLGAVELDKQSALDELADAARKERERQARAEAYAALEGYQYIGECQVTYYCCEPYEHICGAGDGLTATGLTVQPGIVAVDPSVIPLGSTVVIGGEKFLAADTGEAVEGLHVDIAVPTHATALRLGVKNADVWIIPPDDKEDKAE